MPKRLHVLIALICLIGVGLWTVHAQDNVPGCDFEPDPSAAVFDSLEQIAGLGIRPEDINELAVLARDPSLTAFEFLVGKGYDQAQIESILSDEQNAALIDQLIHPSPSRDVLDRVNALLASYGIPSGALLELYKLADDPQALYDNVIARGLSPEQADGFTNAAIELAGEAQRLGVFEYAATLDGQDLLDSYGYTRVRLNSISRYLGDADALREALIRQGVSEADVDSMVEDFQTLTEELGLSEAYVDSWNTKALTYTLNFYGIPSNKVFALAARGDGDAIRNCLSEAGFDESAIDIATSEFGLYLYGEDGDEAWLTADDIVESAFDDAGKFAFEWGFSGEELAELSQYGDDLDALFDILTQDYGFSDEDADFFAYGFDSSIFSAVFDSFDDSYIDFIDGAIEAAENGEYFELDEDFDLEAFMDDFFDDEDFDDEDFDDEDFDDEDFDDEDFDDEDFDDEDFDDEDFDDEDFDDEDFDDENFDDEDFDDEDFDDEDFGGDE